MDRYVIHDAFGPRAIILPEKGATVISLYGDDGEYLYYDHENRISPERPRCGIPFLFPIFGRLTDGTYTWEGKTYHMDIHGFAHTSRWQVVKHTQRSLRLVLEADETTLAQFPFRFRVTLDFTVRDGWFTIEQTYENLDDRIIPYSYGFHPYFQAEKPEDIRVEATAKKILDFSEGLKDFGHGTVSVSLPEGAPETGTVLMDVKAPVTLIHEAEGRKLTIDFDSGIHNLVLWHQAGKKFLCVEPVNGSADGLNTGRYRKLRPGETKKAFVAFRPESL